MKLENLHRKTSSTGDLPNKAEDPEDRIGHVSIKYISESINPIICFREDNTV